MAVDLHGLLLVCVFGVKGSELGVGGSGEIILIEEGALPESMYLSDWPNIIRIYN